MRYVSFLLAGSCICLAGALLSIHLEIDQSRSRFASHEPPRPENDVRDSIRRWSSCRLGGVSGFDPQTCAGSSRADSAPARAGIVAADFVAAERATPIANAFDGFSAKRNRLACGAKPGGL